MGDLFTDALNAPPGRLAEVLINKITSGNASEHPEEVGKRLDRLVDTPGRPGLLARVRLAVDLPLLFEHAPDWTKSRIIPLFDWSSPDAAEVWSARKYSRYIGSPELFGLFKQAFLEMFGRSGIPTEDLRVFSEWLAAILIANRADGAGYPLLDGEARSALRRAGESVLSNVADRLAVEMKRAVPEQKLARWRTVIGPVFDAIWPLDVGLQTPSATFKLVEILCATGDAFPEAADAVIPFIQPDDPREQSTMFSIAEAPEALFRSTPAKILDLIAAVVGDPPPGSVYVLGKALTRIQAVDPTLANTRKFQKLLSYASQRG